MTIMRVVSVVWFPVFSRNRKMMTKQMEDVIYTEEFITWFEGRGMTMDEFVDLTHDAEKTIWPPGWDKEDKERWKKERQVKTTATIRLRSMIEEYLS